MIGGKGMQLPGVTTGSNQLSGNNFPSPDSIFGCWTDVPWEIGEGITLHLL